MKNYVYLFIAKQKFEDTEEFNASWGAWYESLAEHLVDAGNPFNPEAQAQVRGSEVTMDSDAVAGYTIVKANSLEEAVTWAKACPMTTKPGGEVHVYETMPM